MKKLILTCALFASLFTTAFAESNFAHRFFEVKVDVPFSVSNNLIGLSDIFKEKVVIDLPKIADGMGKNGATFNTSIAPSLSINLDIPKGLIFGINLGAEASAGVGLSKDIFQFIGKGNVGMDNVTTKLNNTYADLFAVASINGGWNGKKLRLNITGSAFWALAHMDASNTYVKIYTNEEENTMGVEANVDAKLYTTVNVNEGFSDIMGIFNQTKANLGFDITAEGKYNLFRFLSVGGNARIPIVPSRLNQVSAVSYKYEKEINLMDMISGKDSEEPAAETPAEGEGEGEEAQEDSKFISDPKKLASPYVIHRPMKLGVSADFHPFGNLLSTNGYIGVGIRHPFAKQKSETDFYWDYAVGGRLSLWNILSFELSHSRYDEIFKNQFAVALNIRLVEVDVGVSSQSASFAKAFTGAGIGGFVTVCVGF